MAGKCGNVLSDARASTPLERLFSVSNAFSKSAFSKSCCLFRANWRLEFTRAPGRPSPCWRSRSPNMQSTTACRRSAFWLVQSSSKVRYCPQSIWSLGWLPFRVSDRCSRLRRQLRHERRMRWSPPYCGSSRCCRSRTRAQPSKRGNPCHPKHPNAEFGRMPDVAEVKPEHSLAHVER